MGRSPSSEEKGLKKGPWTAEEDQKLIDFIQIHGHGSWRSLPQRAGLNRCGKSCRLRWTNYLRPDIKRGKFSDEEEQVIINLHSVLGNKWSKIATHLPGRTDNEIKNYWNTHLRKKLLHTGIDPKTHKPVADLNFLANVSRFLSTSNSNNLVNPWDNAIQLAQIQVLLNILQVINTNPLPNIAATNLLGPNYYPQLDGVLVNGPITSFSSSMDYYYSQAVSQYQNLGFIIPEISNNFNVTDQTEYPVPALVSTENSTAKEMDSRKPGYVSVHSPTPNFFEDWDKLMDDEDTSFWNDVIDRVSI